MAFSDKTLTLLVLLSLGLSVLTLLALVSLMPRGRMTTGGADRTTAKALRDQTRAIAELREIVRRLAGEDSRLAHRLKGAIQRVGLVRYDAFDDMGGHLSFSAALLDAAGNGIVVTSINGRTDTRCYAKPVERGESGSNLSDEEAQAIRMALANRVPATAS